MSSRWQTCPGCAKIMLLKTFANHSCNPKIREIQDATFDEFVEEEMEAFDGKLEEFFSTNEAKFFEYLAERDRAK